MRLEECYGHGTAKYIIVNPVRYINHVLVSVMIFVVVLIFVSSGHCCKCWLKFNARPG
jgi:hypothetical protein